MKIEIKSQKNNLKNILDEMFLQKKYDIHKNKHVKVGKSNRPTERSAALLKLLKNKSTKM